MGALREGLRAVPATRAVTAPRTRRLPSTTRGTAASRRDPHEWFGSSQSRNSVDAEGGARVIDAGVRSGTPHDVRPPHDVGAPDDVRGRQGRVAVSSGTGAAP